MRTFAALAGLLAAGFLLIAFVAQPSARMADAAVVPAAAGDVTLVGQIGGAVTAIARSGNLAYIGEGPALAIVDVTNPAAPVSIGRSSLLPGAVGGIAVSGGLAYVATRPAGAAAGSLHVFDVSDPAHPTQVGFFASGGDDVAVSGSFAYLAAGSAGLLIVDISNPASPVLAGQFAAAPVLEVELAGTLAYLPTGESVRIVDVADPANPTEIGVLSGALFAHVALVGNRAYTTNPADLFVFDVSNPASPVLLGNTSGGAGSAGVVAATESYAYVGGGGYGGLAVIDVTNPAAPVDVAFIATQGTDEDIQVTGSTVYFADGGVGLTVIDVASATEPEIIGNHASVPNADDVVLAGRDAYIPGGLSGGLRIVDVADPTAPLFVGAASLGGAFVLDVAVSAPFAYVATGPGGMRVLDVGNPSAPVEVGAFTSPPGIWAVAVSGSLVYAAALDRLVVIDVTNPGAPAQVGTLSLSGFAIQIVVSGTRAYIAMNDPSVVHIVDVANPSAPLALGSYGVPGGFPVVSVATGIAVRANLVHVSIETGFNPSLGSTSAAAQLPLGRIETVDVSDPSAPVLVDVDDTTSPAWDVAITRFFRWTAHAEVITPGFYGVRLSLATNPANPTVLGGLQLPGIPFGIAARGRFAYIAAQSAGLMIVRQG